jgi:hypothetical protein
VRWYNFRLFFENLFFYYLWNLRLFVADMLLLTFYFFLSPYQIVRKYDESHPESPVGPYGETSFREFDRICTLFSIPTSATIIELGAGRGRLAFFLALVRRQKRVVAYEQIEKFVQYANFVKRYLKIGNLFFKQQSWHRKNKYGHVRSRQLI